jgi:Flp pilus assembly protein TadD
LGTDTDDANAIPLQVGPLGKARRWLDESTRPGSPPRTVAAWLAPVALLQVAATIAVLVGLSPSTQSKARAAKSVASTTAPATSAGDPAKTASAAPANSAASAPTALAAPRTAPSSGSKSPPPGHMPLPVLHHPRAPSCKQLLAKEPPRHDGLPGAAYRAIKEARRGLVRGDVDAGQRAYCRAAAFDVHSVTAAVELTRVLLLRRDGRAAADWTRRARERGAGEATVKGLLGDALALTGDFDKARSAWLEANGGRPGDVQATDALADKSLAIARRALHANAYSRAERYFRRAAVLAPDSASAAIGLARTLLMLDVPGDAMVWARYAVAKAPQNPDARIVLGDVLHRKGQDADARHAWEKALELQPGNQPAQSRLRRLGSQ